MKLSKIMAMLGAAGLILAVAVQIVSIYGIDLQELFPPVLGLHLLMILCLAQVVVEYMLPRLSRNSQIPVNKRKSLEIFRDIYTRGSRLYLVITILAILYMPLSNIFFSIDAFGGGPGNIDGVFVVHNHGEVIQEISSDYYHLLRAQEMRMFSSLWIVVFSFSLLMGSSKPVKTGTDT